MSNSLSLLALFLALVAAILLPAPVMAQEDQADAVAPVIEFAPPEGMSDQMAARYRVAATPDRGDASDESCPPETDMIPFEGKMAIPPLRLDASYQEVVAGAPWWVGTYELSGGGNSSLGQLVSGSCARVVLGQQAEPYHPVLLPADQATLDDDRAERLARPQALVVLPPGMGQKDFDLARVDGLFRVLGFVPSDMRNGPSCPRQVGAEVALPTAEAVRKHLGVVGVVDFDLEKPTRAELAHHASWLGTYHVAVGDGNMILVEGSCRDVAGNTDSVQYKAVVLLKKQTVVVDNGTDASLPALSGNGGDLRPPVATAEHKADVGGQVFAAWTPALLGDNSSNDSSAKLGYVRAGGGLVIRRGVGRLVLPYLRVGLYKPFANNARLQTEIAGGVGFGLSAPLVSAVRLDVQLAVLAGRGPVRTACRLAAPVVVGDTSEKSVVCGDVSGSESFPAVVHTMFWGLDGFVGASFGSPDKSIRFVLGAQFGFEHHPLASGHGELTLTWPEPYREETTTSVVYSRLNPVRVHFGPGMRLEF